MTSLSFDVPTSLYFPRKSRCLSFSNFNSHESSADNYCKQFVPRLSLTFCSGSKLFDTDDISERNLGKKMILVTKKLAKLPSMQRFICIFSAGLLWPHGGGWQMMIIVGFVECHLTLAVPSVNYQAMIAL